MRAVYELSDDAGTGRDAHLDHDEPQESLHSVRADVHALRNFFTREPICEMPHGFHFAVGQLKTRQQINERLEELKKVLAMQLKSVTDLAANEPPNPKDKKKPPSGFEFDGGPFESSGVVSVPGTDAVLFVDDGRVREIYWMQLDGSAADGRNQISSAGNRDR